MEKVGSLYHVAVAVRDVEKAERLYADLLGLRVVGREIVEDQGVRTSMLRSENGAGAAIELIEPLDSSSPVSKFLEKRGEGVHHVCFFVDDIEASLRDLKKRGAKLIDERPRDGAYGSKIAFVHPKSMNGVLVELAQKSRD